jgi:hypothetical protein
MSHGCLGARAAPPLLRRRRSVEIEINMGGRATCKRYARNRRKSNGSIPSFAGRGHRDREIFERRSRVRAPPKLSFLRRPSTTLPDPSLNCTSVNIGNPRPARCLPGVEQAFPIHRSSRSRRLSLLLSRSASCSQRPPACHHSRNPPRARSTERRSLP